MACTESVSRISRKIFVEGNDEIKIFGITGKFLKNTLFNFRYDE